MVQLSKILGAIVATCMIGGAYSHPGEKHETAVIKRQVQTRNILAASAKRSLDSCSNSTVYGGLHARNIARRAKVTRELRKKRGIITRGSCSIIGQKSCTNRYLHC
jgi:hypothetical protein